MGLPFILILIGFTSICAYLVGAKRLRLQASKACTAVAGMLECIGITLFFFVVNVMAGFFAVLTARILTQRFVSLHFADETLMVLSLLQGLVFKCWRDLSVQSPR